MNLIFSIKTADPYNKPRMLTVRVPKGTSIAFATVARAHTQEFARFVPIGPRVTPCT